jgi:hypothetical protein
MIPMPPMNLTATPSVDGSSAGTQTAGTSTLSGGSMYGLNASSLSATSESFSISSSPLLADRDLMGLVVLMLTLELMQSDDEEDRKGLMALIFALGQMQQQAGGESFSYSASSMSMDSSSLQAMDSSQLVSGYSAVNTGLQQVPAVDAAMGGNIDITA